KPSPAEARHFACRAGRSLRPAKTLTAQKPCEARRPSAALKTLFLTGRFPTVKSKTILRSANKKIFVSLRRKQAELGCGPRPATAKRATVLRTAGGFIN
ncbi:MAG: hypothetical protein K2H25_03105, partial [Alistipes sp.]|nr:hypothetical protein [Alistipes sp.]